MNHPKNIETKSEAVAYVSEVLSTQPVLLFDHLFQRAMVLSVRFDISARDVLQYRKEKNA